MYPGELYRQLPQQQHHDDCGAGSPPHPAQHHLPHHCHDLEGCRIQRPQSRKSRRVKDQETDLQHPPARHLCDPGHHPPQHRNGHHSVRKCLRLPLDLLRPFACRLDRHATGGRLQIPILRHDPLVRLHSRLRCPQFDFKSVRLLHAL